MHDAEIYLLRHGETVWNRQLRVQGHKDSPLTARGVEQARRYGRTLAAILAPADAYRIVSSPLGRAWQTAVLIAEGLGREPGELAFDDRLKEMGWGDWDGLTAAEIEARDPVRWQARIDDRWTRPPPGGGETQMALFGRALDWLKAVEPGSRLIVVAHGALGRALRSAYLGLDPSAMLELDQPQDAFHRLHRGVVERIEVSV